MAVLSLPRIMIVLIFRTTTLPFYGILLSYDIWVKYIKTKRVFKEQYLHMHVSTIANKARVKLGQILLWVAQLFRVTLQDHAEQQKRKQQCRRSTHIKSLNKFWQVHRANHSRRSLSESQTDRTGAHVAWHTKRTDYMCFFFYNGLKVVDCDQSAWSVLSHSVKKRCKSN